MRKHARESFTYTVVFCLGYLLAAAAKIRSRDHRVFPRNGWK